MPQRPDLSAIRPVLLCGGLGRRLFPLSTPDKPKPFLALCSDKTMLQETALRFLGAKPPVVICNRQHADLVRADLSEIKMAPHLILEEPCCRNTAPAAALAARYFQDQAPDELLLFLPCDHKIARPEVLHAAVAKSIGAAISGDFVLFGETPSMPDTGYGYIRAGEKQAGSEEVLRVQHFHEKPEAERARTYIEDGCYWNTGLLLVRADALAAAFAAYMPEFWECVQTLDLPNPDLESFTHLPDISLDYALLEKIQTCALCPVDMGWSDIGTLDRLRASA
ncbi:MAG: NTP transferase domain-containing protein [Rhodospirillales bacterium]|nr:NTP transferase domain-containing protein [Rhodospirillales bacterium]MCB9964513.1 NTP transferase domain-containing protein [Rhodospirillales bacterium]MCB9973786.1 NTP transferase domain-containing protein [Rhodospirillales bacterium]MCB9980330.1 NTP transferase domain-containing protein [Rhodospirillales bacterium]